MTEELDFSANDRKERALELINAMRHNVSSAIYQMQKLKDEELYKELGYTSLLECLEAELNIKRSTFFNYQKVLDKFSTEPLNSNQSNALDFPSISIRKLVLLSRLPKQQTTRLLREGKMNIRGREYSIERIDQISHDDLKNILAGKKPVAIKKEVQKNVKKEAATEYKTLEKKLNAVLKSVCGSKFIIEDAQAEIQIYIEKCAEIIEQHLTFYMK